MQKFYDILNNLTSKAKNFVNSIRIPGLLSFFISKDGKINPTKEEALKEAPPASENWVRMLLGKNIFGPIKIWMILALPLLMIVVEKGGAALKFFIDFATQGIMIVPLLVICYFLWKSLNK